MAMLVAAAVGGPLRAQVADSARIGPKPAPTEPVIAPTPAPRARTPRPADPTKAPPLAPGAAFLRSALLPGLGQAALDRPVAGAVFFTAEVFSLAMWRKAAFDLREARRFGADTLVISRFLVDNATGREALDSLGRPLVGGSVPNRWSQGNIGSARSTFREDWIAAVVFVHLLAGIDAFVAAQLWDLPAQVSLRPAPMGGATLTLGYRWR
ncbi:MAG: hypothetical protein MUF53_02710 [Gemmatimonadaceae bacterium]|nr:hypothetical protein [Gemmatimonadaceae bacterium]